MVSRALPPFERGDEVEVTGVHPWRGQRAIVLGFSPVQGWLLNMYSRQTNPRRTYASTAELTLATTEPGPSACPNPSLRGEPLE